MTDGSHPDVAPSVLVGSDATFAQRALQPFGQFRCGAFWHLLFHVVEAQHPRVVIEGDPQPVVVVLHDVLAGVTAQQRTAPFFTVEIVEGITVVAYQAAGTCAHPDEAVAVLIDVVDEVAWQPIVHGEHVEMVALRFESAEQRHAPQPHHGHGKQTEECCRSTIICVQGRRYTLDVTCKSNKKVIKKGESIK